MSSEKSRNPKLTSEMLALIENDAPDCGKEFDQRICIMKHRAAKNKEAKGLTHGPCAYCSVVLKFLGRAVTKSADKPETPAIEPQTTQEEPKPMEPKTITTTEPIPAPKKTKPAKPQKTCIGEGCSKLVTVHSKTGRCHSCQARENAKAAHKARAEAGKVKAKPLTAKQVKKLKADLPTPPEAAAMIAASADTIHAKNSDIESVTLDGIEFSHDAEPKTVEHLANKCGYSINTPSSKAESIYRRALRHFGDRNQIFKAAEEASELSAAIMRYMNAHDRGAGLLIALTEELADVEIMCQQMRLVFGDQPIDAAKRQKLERLEGRLSND